MGEDKQNAVTFREIGESMEQSALRSERSLRMAADMLEHQEHEINTMRELLHDTTVAIAESSAPDKLSLPEAVAWLNRHLAVATNERDKALAKADTREGRAAMAVSKLEEIRQELELTHAAFQPDDLWAPGETQLLDQVKALVQFAREQAADAEKLAESVAVMEASCNRACAERDHLARKHSTLESMHEQLGESFERMRDRDYKQEAEHLNATCTHRLLATSVLSEDEDDRFVWCVLCGAVRFPYEDTWRKPRNNR